MTLHDKSLDHVYALAQSLFCKEDWQDIHDSLAHCLPEHSQVIWGPNNEVIGFAIVTRASTTVAQIAFCGVNPCYQGKGYGSKLLKEAIKSIFQAEFSSCRLIVDGWNSEARRLYERLGFCCTGPYKVAHTDGFMMELDR
jgi:ribosomal protein S18 acetylase RimI-like enzyme